MTTFKYLDTAFITEKLRTRIEKTRLARSGDDIYKKRNRRDYRVIIQYKIWSAKLAEEPQFLDLFDEGYAVMVTPQEYFGNYYPNRSPEVPSELILGRNAFVYYTTPYELQNFRPLLSWVEVAEISTKGSKSDNELTWLGEVAYNVRNSNPQKVSFICDKTNAEKMKELRTSLVDSGKIRDSLKLPQQAGLGNYDYDYASSKTMEQVQIQMLWLALQAPTKKAATYKEFILSNKNNPLYLEATEKIVNSASKENFDTLFLRYLKELQKSAQENGLLDLDRLRNIGAIGNDNLTPVCPLCKNKIYLEDFFQEVSQATGREVSGNTQREIVLMHIEALAPGKLNHKPYNLGWGHSWCNTVQGDKSIEETLQKMKDIIKAH